MDFEEGTTTAAPTPDFLASVKVFPLIPYLKKDVIVSCSTIRTILHAPDRLSYRKEYHRSVQSASHYTMLILLRYSYELGVSTTCLLFIVLFSGFYCSQLTASDINFAVVRPLVLKYARLRNMAIIYACMVVRSYFLTQAGSDLAHSNVMHSRATLCEIMAIKLLSHFAASKVQLVAILTNPWNPLSGAPLDIVEEVKEAIGQEECEASSQTAIEVSTLSPSITASICLHRWQ